MKKWFCLPLQEKLKYLTFSVGAVVFLSIAANMLVAFFGLGGFGNILKSNSRSLAFWTAMDEESAAFDRFIQEQTKETRQEWEKSAKHTELMLEELPYKYKEIGKERYARTWTLHNLYENYDISQGTDGKGNHWGSGYAGGVQAAPDPGISGRTGGAVRTADCKKRKQPV